MSLAAGPSASAHFADYSKRLSETLSGFDWAPVEELAADLLACWKTGSQVFFAGNGGSAGNANHLANDFLYPVSKRLGSGLRAHSLAENPAVLACLANDEGYENVFSYQLAVMAQRGDLLIVFSGSGNSPNIVKAIEQAKNMGVKTFAITGFSGGKCRAMADVPIHFAVDDMQIAEDTQTIVGHMIVQWLFARRDQIAGN